jgi:hypothetical protein
MMSTSLSRRSKGIIPSMLLGVHHRTAPHRTAPHRTAPHRTAPHRTAPHRTAPHRTAPHHITLPSVWQCGVMLTFNL